jgi:hypothetical protein
MLFLLRGAHTVAIMVPRRVDAVAASAIGGLARLGRAATASTALPMYRQAQRPAGR